MTWKSEKSPKFLPRFKLRDGHVLLLKILEVRRSSDSFGSLEAHSQRTSTPVVYRERERVRPHIWRSSRSCGDGIHAWYWGRGHRNAASYCRSDTSVWAVLSAKKSSLVPIRSFLTKVKAPLALVRFIGTYDDCKRLINHHLPQNHYLRRRAIVSQSGG